MVAPQHLPLPDQVQASLTAQERDNIVQYSEDAEQEHEFDKYLFDDFLTDVEPHMLRHDTPDARNRYILQQIELDRERLIREAIMSINNKQA